MWLDIRFTDGSSPYRRSGTELELQAEMRQWKKDYHLEITPTFAEPGNYLGGVEGYNVIATKKPPRLHLRRR